MSATHSAQSDQANQEAVRRLIPLTASSCSLALSVTISVYTTTTSKALRSSNL
jgi:hypothetical protein